MAPPDENAAVLDDPFRDLTPPYGTLVVDPPWPYDARPAGYQRESGKTSFLPYSEMSVDEIVRLPVMDLAAPGAHLYIWTTSRFLFDAQLIAAGWGFDYVQTLVWCKRPTGKGPGGRFVNTAEFIISATRAITEKRQVIRAGAVIREAREAAGMNRSDLHRAVRGGKPTGIVFRWESDDSLPTEGDWDRLQVVLPALAGAERPYVSPPEPKEQARIETSWWEWPRSHHSVKPPAFLDIVEQVSPGPYVELFAREPRLGWDSWGHGYEATPTGSKGAGP